MTYMNKNAELKNGYNAYIDADTDDMGTLMDVGLLLMEEGDTYVFEEAEKEIAVLLFSGSVTYEWDGKVVEADRPDCFHYEAYCLLAGKGNRVIGTSDGHIIDMDMEEALAMTKPFQMERYDVLNSLTQSYSNPF